MDVFRRICYKSIILYEVEGCRDNIVKKNILYDCLCEDDGVRVL